MGLTYQDLLEKIEASLDSKIDDKFLELLTEIKELKGTNSKLIEINKALIAQNNELRARANSDDKGECLSVSDDEIIPLTADHVLLPAKKFYDVLTPFTVMWGRSAQRLMALNQQSRASSNLALCRS